MAKHKKKPVVKAGDKTVAIAQSNKTHDISKNKYRCETCKKEITGANMPKHNSEHKGQTIHYTLLH